MALEYALLVTLLEKPSSGYDLARRFDRSIGYFWHATHQQIYRTLARMEADGWIRVKELKQGGRPDKKTYSVTAKGRKALSVYVREPSDPEGARIALLVKLRGAVFDDPAFVTAEIERHRELHQATLLEYRKIEARLYPRPAELNTAQCLQHLALRSGIYYEQGWIAWCGEALLALAERRPRSGFRD